MNRHGARSSSSPHDAPARHRKRQFPEAASVEISSLTGRRFAYLSLCMLNYVYLSV